MNFEAPPVVEKPVPGQEDAGVEAIKSMANYEGDWTLLLRERMLDPITEEKFIRTRQESMNSMKTGELGQFDKGKNFTSHYQQQIDDYKENIEKIFNSTETGLAESFSKRAIHLGKGSIGEVGAVFTDAATAEGESLSIRQKNIIESHEKGHGLRDFTARLDQSDFRSALDMDMVHSLEAEEQAKNPEKRFANYLTSPDEIAERMAQLKNYYGFKAGDEFTLDHLKYAQEHYVQDTGLDNNMSVFLKAVTPETTQKFLEVINKYPL